MILKPKESHFNPASPARASKIKLADVVSSPFRDFTINPLDEVKIAALIESISTTGFWKNIVVREVGPKFEIILGHHRVEALRRLNYKEIEVTVEKLTDAEALRKWSRDHSDVYEHGVVGVIELVGATVKALATGAINRDAMPVSEKTRIEYLRNAPSFVRGCVPELGTHHYTSLSVAKFLGMSKKNGEEANLSVEVALSVLELVERGFWDGKHINTCVSRETGKITVRAIAEAIRATELAEIRRKEVIQRQTEEFQRQQAEQKKRFEEAEEAQAEAQRIALEARRKEAELKKQKDAEERTKKEQQRVRDAEEKRKKAEEALRKAEERKEREKARIARSKKSREQEKQQKERDAENVAKGRKREKLQWENTVIEQVNKTYDRISLVHVNVHALSGKFEKNMDNVPFTADGRRRLIAALEQLGDRVKVHIELLRSGR
jgi:hypothetical protein